MSYCGQLTITDSAFSHLKGIQDLDMNYCPLPAITRVAFSYLIGASLEPSFEEGALLEGCTLAMIAGAEEFGLLSHEEASESRELASDYVAPPLPLQ